MSASNGESEFEPTLWVSVFGGKKEKVQDSLKNHLGPDEDTHSYSTWINVSVMRRLGFLFVGGVESSGGIFDLLCMFSVLALVVGVFVFWNIVIVFVVIIVLMVFSGDAAYKYLKGTFIEADATKVNSTKLESFVEEQVADGHFVLIRSESGYNAGPHTKQSTTATSIFRLGIHICLIVATLFFVAEVVYYFLSNSWYTELPVLVIVGASFLIGIAIMDLGVLLRRQLSKNLKLDQNTVL